MHPYGWLSLLPPVVAIVLAMATRRVIASLLAAIAAGALITAGGNPLVAIGDFGEVHLWKTLVDEDKLRIFAFTLIMGAMVGVVNRSGGMQGLIQVITPFANTRRRGQLATWMLGLLIFFDDYANTVLLGGTLRPLCDRLRISREKLAYLVDSTAAPVAGLALVSTWVAGEIAFVQLGLEKIPGNESTAIELFIASIPYRFYVLWALAFVALVALMNRDFGPMLRAERKRVHGTTGGERPGAVLEHDPTSADPNTPARWYNALVPVAVTVGAILWLLYSTGKAALADAGSRSLMDIFGQANAYYALLWGSLAGLCTAVLLVRLERLLDMSEVTDAALSGMKLMLPALVILWLASALSAMTGNEPLAQDQPVAAADTLSEMTAAAGEQEYPLRYRLYTAEFLGQQVGQRIPPTLLPTIVFLLSAVTAFATGTSWGTMGILMPMVVPLAYAAASGDASAGDSPVLVASVGSVLAGAIFGDHCSPISDTTILSSQASGCDHLSHVWTQMPYALVVAAISVICGTLPVGFGVPVGPLLAIGGLVLAAIVFFVGRPADREI